ncbi:hypothetical protein GCM10023210_09750 [Chryseobacterium ginsengisoli]|uniref:Uncharacterized protein n=2 Tax=Chryseobacterium ginsengisoli TaxID=363853 RepID=A0ABP9M2D8_9FLAO
MFDKINFFIPINISHFGNDESITIGNLKLDYNKMDGRVYYETYYKKMRFRLTEIGLGISNSVSQIIYGHNAFDLNYLEFKQTILEICNKINCTKAELIVKSFEFGLTVQTYMKTEKVLLKLQSHKKSSGKQEFRRTKLTGVKFYHCDYELKFYDKAHVEKIETRHNILEGNHLRIEMMFRKKHFPNGIKTAEDLCKIENINQIYKMLMKEWDAVVKIPVVNHEKLSKEEIHKIYAILSSAYQADRLDYVSRAAVRKEQQRFKDELQTIGDFSIFNEITNAFAEKFTSLMNVP